MYIRKTLPIVFVLILALALFAACGSGPDYAVYGNGNIVEQLFHFDATEGLGLDISGFRFYGNVNANIIINENLSQNITVTTDQNIGQRITVSEIGSTISIRAATDSPIAPTQLTISTGLPITSLVVDGAWYVTDDGSGVDDRLIQLLGASSGSFSPGQLDSLHVILGGAANINMRGMVSNAQFDLSGSAQVNAFDLIAQRATINISGYGSCDITVHEELNATISGMGRITFDGSPAVQEQIDGLGSVTQRNP